MIEKCKICLTVFCILLTCFVPQIVVEGVKAGPSLEGDMAFDDVQLTDDRCPPRGFCDFENTMCNWSNLGGGTDQADWLHGRGGSPNPHTGPSVDHTTNSTQGKNYTRWRDIKSTFTETTSPRVQLHSMTGSLKTN